MSDEKNILVIDEGTTSTRAVIYDKQGNTIASDQSDIQMYYPKPGWVEQDANDIWLKVQATMATALLKADIRPEQISGIGITNQRETTVIWDKKTGLPIHKAIVWQSRQTAPIAEKLIEEGQKDIVKTKTGLIIDAYFSATKIRYILDNVPGAQQKAENGDLLFGTIDSWLLWKLTGGKVHATDYSNASRTMLFDISKLRWSTTLMDMLNIPQIMLPEVKDSSGIFGNTIPEHFFGGSIPIAGIIGDQQGALFGHLALTPGSVKNTYGTGSFIVMNTGKERKTSENGLLTTIAYGMDGEVTYALEGSVFVAGSAIQWLRDNMKLVATSPDSEKMALESESNDEVYVVPAFTGLGAPYWNPDARGAVFGLSRGTTRNDFVKATLQSLAYQSRDVVDAMVNDTKIPLKDLHVDGGASLNNYLMQFQADLLNTPVIRANNVETTAQGAAYLAGLATGFWKNSEELKSLQGEPKTFNPNMESTNAEKLYKGWKNAVKATELFSKEQNEGE